MYDPLGVLYEIRRPWPKVSEQRGLNKKFHKWPTPMSGWKKPGSRTEEEKELGFYEWGQFEWLRHVITSSFWYWGNKEIYWPSLITIWHKDPESDGTDNSCNWPNNKWRRFHIHHMKLQIHPIQHFRRRFITKCCVCGDRFKGEHKAAVGSWHHVKTRYWRSEANLRHFKCDGLYNESMQKLKTESEVYKD